MDEKQIEDEAMRLWKAVKRDLLSAVESFGALSYPGQTEEQIQEGFRRRNTRLMKNWAALEALAPEFQELLYHGWEQVETMLGRPQDEAGPMWRGVRELEEMAGVLEIGREANPDAKVETVGDLYTLGEQAIRDEIEEDFG
jgi:hypothetical protein